MLNIIVPIVEDVEKFSDFVKEVCGKNTKVFVGIRENLADKFLIKNKNVEVHIYSNKSNKEEIINALHTCKMQKGKLMVVRRPLTYDEFVSLSMSTKNIATLKSNHNKFVNWFKKITSALIRKFFAFSFFEDISAICYNESLFELLSVCNDLSIATRINKYVGVEIEEITAQEKQVKKDYNRSKNALRLLAWIAIFFGSLAGGICVCIFTKLQVLTVILVICWLIVALTLLFVGLINFTRTLSVGNLRFGRAEEKL